MRNPFDRFVVPTWVLIPAALFVTRFLTLRLSGFGWYHGFNEAVYTEIAAGYAHNPWTPMRHGVPFFDTGPWTTYMMWASYSILQPWAGNPGAEEAALRFGVLLAYPLAVWAAYLTGNGLYGRGKGRIAAILVATSPWVLLWFGRAQTDAWMVTGILLFLAGLANPAGRRGAALIVAGLAIGVLSKQPALMVLIAVPMLHPWPRNEDEPAKLEFRATGRRVWILAGIGLALGLSWWGTMKILHHTAFTAAQHFHESQRLGHYFENWPWVTAALILGSGALVFFSWKAKKPNLALLALFLGYAFFALIDSPVGHEYYALPAVAILAVMASNWKWNTPTLSACVAVSLLLTIPLLGYTGDLDDTQAREVGQHMFTWPDGPLAPWSNATIVAPDRLVPQLELYSGRTIEKNGTEDPTVGAFIVSWDSLPCPAMFKTARTFKNPALGLYDCRHRSLDTSETVNESDFLVRA